MMGEVTEMSKNQPHTVITCESGNSHVIPLSVLRDIGNRRTALMDLEDWEEIVPTIIRDWIELSAARDCVDV